MARTDAEIRATIEQHLDDANESLQKAVNLAEKHDLSFHWSGPADEMEFSYSKFYPWESSGSCEWEESGEDQGGWVFEG